MPQGGRARDASASRFAAIVATLATILIVGGVAFAVTQAVHHDTTAPPVTLPPASTVLGRGAHAPEQFTLPALGGGPAISLAAVLHGRPSVVNFFASWCTVCQAELPEFAQAAATYGARVAFVGIDTNDTDPSAAFGLAHRSGVRYPLMNDTGAQRVKAAYGVADSMPVTFVLDATGRVRWEILGQVTKTALASELAPLLTRATR